MLKKRNVAKKIYNNNLLIKDKIIKNKNNFKKKNIIKKKMKNR
jgi:hypothetical protein